VRCELVRQLEASQFSSGAAAERCQPVRTGVVGHNPKTLNRWKPLPSNAVKIMTENTNLFVIVICKV
jgi:hypothetical protein